jgi:RimJ/RimL family protein N-acetyltransferase
MNEYLPHYADAIRFLDRDPYVNRELLLALCYEPVTSLRLAWAGGSVSGVLVRGPGPFNPDPDWLRIDARDADAVHALMAGVALEPRLVVSIHRPWIGRLLSERYGLRPTGAGVYGYIVERAQLSPPHASEARLLTASDSQLVEQSGCGWTQSYFARLFEEGRRPWAIVRDGRIVSRASSGYPYAESEEVVGVWTHPQWRGHGLARQLVRAVAADIVKRFHYATYTTTYDNLASQAVARAVGFQPNFAADSLQMPPAN